MPGHDRFSTESGSTFIPFWERLPRFLLYPMQTGSMLRIAGYSIFGGLSMVLPAVFGGLLQLILWIVFLKYAFLVMERTSNGRFDEPSDVNGHEEGDTSQVVRQFGLFIVFGLVFTLFTTMFGEIGYGLSWLMMNVIPPAGIMIIAVSRSFWQALNPAQIIFYIKTIGSPYLALCFLLLSLTASGTWLQEFLYGHMDSWLALPLLSFIEFYFVLITYHMMGYAIYQYHEALGIHAEVSFEEATAKLAPEKAADPFLTKMGALISSGQENEALDLLREELRIHWDRNDLHERYQRLLLATNKQEAALNHGREFIHKLINEKRMFQALDLYEQSLKLDPEFQLQNSNHVYELASAAKTGNRQNLALTLMRGFDKRNPGHPHIPSVYLLAAKILSEHFKKDKEAMQILHTLQTKFPDHSVAEEARQYLEVLQKFAPAS